MAGNRRSRGAIRGMDDVRQVPAHPYLPDHQTGAEVCSGVAPMTFTHPWALLLVVLPIAWAVWEWRNVSRRAGLVLKAGAFAAIAIALSAPRLTVYQSKVALAVLADTSASI